MGLSINIPKNDYIQPTEIRQDVVQGIVDVLLEYIKYGNALRVKDDNDGLYLQKDKKRLSCDHKLPNIIRVNGAEVDAAFKALDGAGYFLYGEYNITRREHSYYWSVKPRHNNYEPNDNVSFSVFID